MFAGFIFTGRTVHCEPCLSLAIGSQSSCLGWMRAIAFSFLKALSVAAGRAFNHLIIQSANYKQYITISNSPCQEKSYLTYIIFSNILRVWLNQRRGIGRCISASGASISGYLVRKQELRTFARSAKAHTGTSRAGLKKVQQARRQVVY